MTRLKSTMRFQLILWGLCALVGNATLLEGAKAQSPIPPLSSQKARSATSVVSPPTSFDEVFPVPSPNNPPIPPNIKDTKPKTVLFRLKNASGNEVAEVIRKIYENTNEPVSVAADIHSNSVIVHTHPEIITALESVIQAIDVPTTSKPNKSDQPARHRVQLFWLVNNLDEVHQKGLSSPAKTLAPALKELAELGIENLGQVSHVIVNSNPKGKFHIKCSPDFNGKSVKLVVQGALSMQGEVPLGKIEIEADTIGPSQEVLFDSIGPNQANQKNLVSLSTEVSAPPGHFIVLGATPIGKSTSVFVLQILE